jgi:hypothetical protein
MFIYRDDFRELSYYLIKNNCGADIFFTNIGQVDFVLLLHECPGKAFAEQLLSKLKNLPGILAAYLINLESVKEASGLLEEMELHLIPYTTSKNKPK